MQQDINITMGDLFRFLRRGFLLALLLAVAGAAAAYYLSSQRPPVYQANATVLAPKGDIDVGSFGIPRVTAPPISVSGYRLAATSDTVLRDALIIAGTEEVSQSDVANLRDRMNVTVDDTRESSSVTTVVNGGSAEGVANQANALARALINWDENRATEFLADSVSALDQQIANLDARISELEASGAPASEIERLNARRTNAQENVTDAESLIGTAASRLSVVQAASIPVNPIAPRPVLFAVFAAAFGFLLGYALLLVRNMLDTRLRSASDLETATGLPILGEFPKLPKKARRLPREASGYLRTNLLFATSEADTKVILVTSPQTGEGKSSVALSLAESFTRADYRTLLVDADLRRPVIAKEYNLDDKRHMPLRAHLENPHDAYEAAHVSVNLTQRLDIIPTFRAAPSPTELLSLGFQDCLESWRKDYDVIVIDSAPILDVADTLTIAPLCTGTVLVASLQDTEPQEVNDAVELLNRSRVNLLGIVATHVNMSPRSSRYDYDSVDVPGEYPAISDRAVVR